MCLDLGKGTTAKVFLVRISESVKRYLDRGQVAAALLTDLSKAFDCLPHDLLVSKALVTPDPTIFGRAISVVLKYIQPIVNVW